MHGEIRYPSLFFLLNLMQMHKAAFMCVDIIAQMALMSSPTTGLLPIAILTTTTRSPATIIRTRGHLPLEANRNISSGIIVGNGVPPDPIALRDIIGQAIQAFGQLLTTTIPMRCKRWKRHDASPIITTFTSMMEALLLPCLCWTL